MLKYFKDAFTNYEYAQFLQSTSLILFVVFFTALVFFIWKRPKEYYNEDANLPLDDNEK
jgi:cytochrome c oxidase cbb3-type subunit 4